MDRGLVVSAVKMMDQVFGALPLTRALHVELEMTLQRAVTMMGLQDEG